VEIEIAASAFRHGVAEGDIRSVLNLPFRIVRIEGDRILFIGGDGAGQLLEVIVVDAEEEAIVIHAMPLRSKFMRFLG
jgi:hypothetical protein